MIAAQNRKSVKLAAVLLSTTAISAISTEASACPSAVSGTITINSNLLSTNCILGSGSNNLIVTNTGTLQMNELPAVTVSGTATSIDNSGVIDGGEGGIRVDIAATLGSITNNKGAQIIGDEDGWGDSSGIFVNSATLNGDITNSGTIISENQDGIRISGGVLNSKIINQADGEITGYATGVFLSNSSADEIYNAGAITGQNWHGIHVDASDVDGSVTNDTGGVVQSKYSGILINNESSVGGDVINAGTITLSNGGFGIEIDDAIITGQVKNSGKIDTTGSTGGIRINGAQILSFENTADGNIDISGNGVVVANTEIAEGFIHNGIIKTSVTDTAVIFTNTDVLDGGISFGKGSTTSSSYAGLYLDNSGITGDITNAGSITAGSGKAVYLYGTTAVTGDIINTADGTIDGYEGGIYLEDASVSGDILNEGTIEGEEYGLLVGNSTVSGKIINKGTINGNYSAIYIYNPGSHITIDNSGTVGGDISVNNTTINLDSGTVFAGDLEGDSSSILNINTDLSTSEGYEIGTINVAESTTFTTTDSIYFIVNNKFSNKGTFNLIGNNTTTVQGDYEQSADGQLNITVGSTSVYSKLVVNGAATFAPVSKIYVDVDSGAVFNNNDLLADVISATSLTATQFTVEDSSLLYDFTAQVESNTVDLVIGVSGDNSVSESVSNQGNSPSSGAAQVFDQLIDANPGGDMGTVLNALGTLSTDKEVSDAVAQTIPTLTGGSTTAILQTLDTVGQVVQARQEMNSGLSSGDDIKTNRNFWMKPFGTWSDQGREDNVSGFDANTYGLVGGADGVVSKNWRLGGAFAYANTSAESDEKLNKLWVDTYQAIFYGSYSLDNRTEANFQADLGYNQNDSKRIISFGGLDRVAEGEFDSYSAHIGGGIGRTYNLGSNTSFTPSARVDYNIIYNESYTETGAGALNLDVDSQSTDQLIPAAHAKINQTIGKNFMASVNGGVGYDLLTSQNAVTSSFVGGGSSFVTRGLEPSPWVVSSGAGLTYKANDNIDVSARYDREDRGEFDTQTVSLKVRMPF